MSARIGSAWTTFRELSDLLSWEAGFIKQRGKTYQCCVRTVLLNCCETWELTAADEARLFGVERSMFRICGVRLVDSVSTDALRDRVNVVVKIKDMMTQSVCRHQFQICELMELKITGKRGRVDQGNHG